MHELFLIDNIIKKINEIVEKENAKKVSKVYITLGALSHISVDHFREHFDRETIGTIAEEAALEVTESADMNDPLAQEIVLDSLDLTK